MDGHGPINNTLLYMQEDHRSAAILDGEDPGPLTVKRSSSRLEFEAIDDRIKLLLQRSGFWGITQIGAIPIDHNLITALVERWRPETHTFHLPSGETTITLQDIAVLTRLPVDGCVVSGLTNLDWKQICHRFLGVMPPDDVLSGSRIKLNWLANQFNNLREGADEAEVVFHARAYILRLLGGIIFPDKSSARVHLMFLPLIDDFDFCRQISWGSACLAWLYRELCRASARNARDIAGACVLVQLWAWDRLPSVRPDILPLIIEDMYTHTWGSRWKSIRHEREVSIYSLLHYRIKLDMQGEDDILWQPYSEDIISTSGRSCDGGHMLGRAKLPLICFFIVEWQNSDRVLRQFGWRQPIPPVPYNHNDLHAIDLRGRETINWIQHHWQFSGYWSRRYNMVVTGGVASDVRSKAHAAYMRWYRDHTVRFLTKEGKRFNDVSEGLEQVYINTASSCSASHMAIAHEMSQKLLQNLQAESRIRDTAEASEQPLRIPDIPPQPIMKRGGRRHVKAGQSRGTTSESAEIGTLSQTVPTPTLASAFGADMYTPRMESSSTSFSHATNIYPTFGFGQYSSAVPGMQASSFPSSFPPPQFFSNIAGTGHGLGHEQVRTSSQPMILNFLNSSLGEFSGGNLTQSTQVADEGNSQPFVGDQSEHAESEHAGGNDGESQVQRNQPRRNPRRQKRRPRCGTGGDHGES